MSERDFYDILGVARTADAGAIKSAYRKLAMKWHPDQNPGDKKAEETFKEIGEAYAILSDPEKRAAYDRYGRAAFQSGGMGGGSSGGPGGFAGDPFDILNEVFGDMFGGGGAGGGARRRAGPARGADLRYDLEITLEDAFAGKETTLKVPTRLTCETCEGSGAKPGTQPETCGMCGGVGQVRVQQGFFTMQRTCTRCGGRGQTLPDPCRTCGGRGAQTKDRQLQVKIPAGVEEGTRIRLSGEGEAGQKGGARGDLYIFISIEEHDLFERHGADLLCRAPVPMATAALGGMVEIPTIDGSRTRVDIPPGAQTGHRLRVRDKGMSVLNRQERGDLHIDLFVETPVKLNAKQKKLLQEFADACDASAHPETQGFFNRAKKFFDGLSS